MARDRRHQQPVALPARDDKARYAGDGVAVVVAESRALAKDAAELVEVDYEPLPAVDRRRGGAGRRRAARPRGVRHEPLLHVAAQGRRGRRQALRRGGRDRRGALPPAAADPEPDGAARRARAAAPGDRRDDALLVDADPAHRARDARARDRRPRVEAARGRARTSAAASARSSRSTRRRRSGSSLAKRLGLPGEVDRGALGERARDPSTGAT